MPSTVTETLDVASVESLPVAVTATVRPSLGENEESGEALQKSDLCKSALQVRAAFAR